jgi:beta-lactamase superfamily II metal-dependent hydrolase
LGIAALIAVVAWLGVLFSGPRPLEITFFDVGDGLCAVLRSPSGHTLVMDCGTSGRRDNTYIGRKLVGPYLQSLGLDGVDVAVLTHPHADHASGFAGLLKMEPAALVLECGAKYNTPEHAAFLRAVRACRARYRNARRGQVLDMGDGVTARILDPSPGVNYKNLNDNSIVMRITYKRVAVLLAADASEAAERDMLDSGLNLRAQVLQVGHHGSNDATGPKWLSAVRPRIAIISCARRSHYGFPSRQVLDRLASINARTYSTGQYGAVTISTDGDTIDVRTVRDRP